jgi:prophage regulatory protein
MVQRILRRSDVESATGLPRSTIYERMAAGTFPKPVPLGVRAVGWLEEEIINWQKRRIAERDAPRRDPGGVTESGRGLLGQPLKRVRRVRGP